MNQTTRSEPCDCLEAVAKADTRLSLNPSRNSGAVSRQVVHGTIWTLAGRLAAMSASFVSTPFLTRLLSAEQYGIWALAETLTAYLTFSNMGMGIASTRFAAKPYACKDDAGEVAVVWTSLLIALVPAAAVTLVVVLAVAPLVGPAFGVPEHLQPDAEMVVRLTALGFLARIIADVFNTPQLVRLRIDWYASLSTGLLIIQHGAVVIALLLGSGLRGAVLMVASSSVLAALTHGFVSRMLQPALFRPRIDATLVGPLLRFGRDIVLISLMGFVLTNLERLFLAHFGSVRDLAYYAIAAKLISLVTLISASIGQPLLPALSGLHATMEKLPFQRLCVQTMRIVMFCVIPVSFMLCVAAEPLVRVWAGPEYASHSAILIYILIVGAVVASIGYIFDNLLTAAGRTGILVRCTFAELIPYIIYTPFLTFQFGAAGAAVAWSLRMWIHPLLLFIAAHDLTAPPIWALARTWRSHGIALLILVGAGTASFWVGEGPLARIATAAAGCSCYCAVVWTNILSPGERETLLKVLRRGRKGR
jgi:O-antigen/teichoic acid export membrane protein